ERYPMRTSTPAGSAAGSRPKTRTVPLVARNRPRTCLMSVVLPAPLTPTSPKTTPRGMVSRTLSSATFGPNRRVSPATPSPLGPNSEYAATIGSRLLGLQEFVALPHEFDHVFGSDAQLPGLGEQGVDAFGENLQPLPAGQRRAGGRHVGSRGPP